MRKDSLKRLIEILDRRKGTEGSIVVPTLHGKQKHHRIMIDYILYKQNREKYFVVELIDLPWRREVRIGYYILGKKQSIRGKWRWGQFAPFVPQKDILALFKKAQILIRRNKEK